MLLSALILVFTYLTNVPLVNGRQGKPWTSSICSNYSLFQSTLSPNYTSPSYTFYPLNDGQLKFVESLNLSVSCERTLKYFHQQYQSQENWAYHLLDACGQPSSGILSGNTFYSGSYDQCLDVKVNAMDQLNLTFTGTFWKIVLSCTGIKYNGSRVTESLWDQRRVEICAPSTCNSQDIRTILTQGSGLTVVEQAKSETYYDLPFDQSEKFIICSFTLLGLLLAIATLLDCYLVPYETIVEAKYRTESSLDGMIASLVYCFSVRRNFHIVTSIKASRYEISCLNGWRTLSIVTVILGHVCMITAVYNSLNREGFYLFVEASWFQVIANASLWTDTFFVLSGFLVAHGSVRRISGQEISKSSKETEPQAKISAFLKELFHSSLLRYFRLTPTLVWMIMVFIMARRLGDGPHWDFLIQSLYTSVYRDMWKSLTYSINLFNVSVNPITGLVATWFLSADFQFFIVSSLTLALTNSGKPILGWCLNGLIMACSMSITAWLTYVNDYPPVLLFDRLCEDDYFQNIYVKPWTRISAYCIGIFLHEIWSRHRTSNLSKSLANLLLTLSFLGMSLVVLSSANYYRDKPIPKLERVLYGSLHRPFWSICVSYLIFHGASRNSNTITLLLSWSGFRFFARLAYQALYWHFFVIYFILGNFRTPVNGDAISYIVLIITTLVFSFLLSFFSVMAFESPFLHLLSIFRHNGIPVLDANPNGESKSGSRAPSVSSAERLESQSAVSSTRDKKKDQ